MDDVFTLEPQKLRRLAPAAKPEIISGLAVNAQLLADYGLSDNPLRLCHFLAQAAHETAGFRTLHEYGSSGYFERLYGNRRDLGNLTRADGAKYRGRGIFQLTGRANYQRYGRLLAIDLENLPELAARPDISLRIACAYWRQARLDHWADENDLRAVTRRINGGLNGFADRRRYLRRAYRLWAELPVIAPRPADDSYVLGRGSRGLMVWRLQLRLRRAGFKLMLDGLFGTRTSKVLKIFQKRHGLRIDGIYGPRTRAVLRLATEPQVQPKTQKPAVTPAPSADPPPAASAPSVPPKPKETFMDDWKHFLLSRTIWANAIGFAALMLDMFGFAGIAAEDQSQLVDQFLKLIEAGGFVAGILFRALARDRLLLTS